MPRGTNKVQQTIGAYADCLRAMESAKARDGVKIVFPTNGDATSFRKRCYRVRAMLIANYLQTNPELIPQSPYDELYIQLEGPTVIIRKRIAPVSMTDLDGNPIDLEAEVSENTEQMPDIDFNALDGLDVE